jgi:hypothetical protein
VTWRVHRRRTWFDLQSHIQPPPPPPATTATTTMNGYHRGRINTAPVLTHTGDEALQLGDPPAWRHMRAGAIAAAHAASVTAPASPAEPSPAASAAGSSTTTAAVNPSGFLCPMCKVELATKVALLAHRCGHTKQQTLDRVRRNLQSAKSVRLTPEALERWAAASTSPPGANGSSGGHGGAVRRRAAIAAAASASTARAGSHQRSVSNGSSDGSGSSDSIGGYRAAAVAQQQTGFICPHCKETLPGKRELLLHRCRDANDVAAARGSPATPGVGGGASGGSDGAVESSSSSTPSQRKGGRPASDESDKTGSSAKSEAERLRDERRKKFACVFSRFDATWYTVHALQSWLWWCE